MPGPWNIHLLTSWDEVLSDAFWARWESWYAAASSRHVFFSPVLAKVWLDTYLPLRNLNPLYVVAESEGVTVFLPLVLWRRNWKNAWQRVVVPVGDSDYDYHDPLVEGDLESINWSGFWESLRDVVRERCDVCSLDGIRSHCVPSGQSSLVQSETALFADLRGCSSGDEYLSRRGHNLRHDLKRRIRRLGELGTVAHRVFAPDQVGQALASVSLALKHHRKRWPLSYKAPGFHERLVRKAVPSGLLLVSCLEVNGAEVAWRLNLADGPVVRDYIVALDDSWSPQAPAKVLRYHDMDYAIRQGFEGCDFLRGAEDWKASWATNAAPLYRMGFRSGRPASLVRTWLIDSARPRLQRLAAKQTELA
jgi:CelD/BcsL family acetyltransferase involved in cellulose biosynthesis